MLTKIRILLLTLTFALAGTAITIHYTINDNDVLDLDQREISKSIHYSENKIESILRDSVTIKTFENVDKYPLQTAEITEKLKANDFILFYIYKNHQLVHWSSNAYVPVTDVGFKGSTTYIKTENRSYVVKKKELKNNISVLALIPIKRDFNSTNEYLTSKFQPGIFNSKNVDVAEYADTDVVRNIYSKDNSYLFSVKLLDGKKDNIFIKLQFICWLASIICFLIWANSICFYLAQKGRAWLSLLLFSAIIILVRYLDLKTNWLAMHSSLAIFDPKFYAYNELLPNLWSFLMITAFSFWLVCYIYTIQRYLNLPKLFKKSPYPIVLAFIGILSIYVISKIMYIHMGTLLTHTNSVENDFTKILNLGSLGWYTLLILCFNVLTLTLYIDLIVLYVKNFIPNITLLLNIQLTCLVIALILMALYGFSTLFSILVGFLIMVRSYRTYSVANVYKLSVFIITIVLLSFISVHTYTHFNKIKKQDVMRQAINYLQAEDDANALSLFMDMEYDIVSDIRLANLLILNSKGSPINYVSEYIKSTYLSGYLSKFEFQSFLYDDAGNPLENYSVNKAEEYREKVITNAVKIPQTNSFYRVKSDLGTQEYFAHVLIPYPNDPNKSFQLYLNFKNLSYNSSIPYPELLSDSRTNLWQYESFQNNSYALYKDGSLITQFGNFNYFDNDFKVPKKIKEYIFLKDRNDYMHLAYKPDIYSTLILSKHNQTFWESVALASILFLLFFMFFIGYNSLLYLNQTIGKKSFRLRNIKYHFRQLMDNIQYSTRIQSLVILSVISGILISGGIAFLSINKQLESNIITSRLQFISEISKKMENSISSIQEGQEEKIIDKLKSITNATVTNFNLFDKNGKLLYSSQPRIYNMQLISDFINPNAYKELKTLRKAESYFEEQVGEFKFKSVYSTIKNDEYKTIAYLNIPYYSSQKEALASKNFLLNTILNIYTIIIIIFGFLSVIVSRKITEPLAIVRQKLANTQLTNKINEPLFWERNDEIGLLIKEYNHMLIKLEQNAQQLRDAERESAWREMARQVAHEIKNPLTPMKLGIQYLMRAYRDNDPRFHERFNKISNSFIDQIDSLSTIATEFSHFAKLPETKSSKINLTEKILKVINLYSNTPNTNITLTNNTGDASIFIMADRDQLIRTFNNLFKNAIEAKSMHKKHIIKVILDYADNNSIRIQVQDNGVGIPEDVMPMIFKPNFTTKSSGTGLGLAFVKQTITGLGGEISFITENNVGTNFIISIPRYTEES